MSELVLVIGNKNYSSWSMRAWLALKKTGRPFREEKVLLYQDNWKAELQKLSPSGKVPVLVHGEAVVWESLAICEYLAELCPEAKLWPRDPVARAQARAVSTEMHAGFARLRENMPMDLTHDRHRDSRAHLVTDEIGRVQEIWTTMRQKWGAGGPFLFGDFTIADAMFAPMVSRFRTYGVVLNETSNAYMSAVLDHSAFKEWEAGALSETAVIEFDVFRHQEND